MERTLISRLLVSAMAAVLFFTALPAMTAAAPAHIVISAAASLTNVMQALGEDFNKRHRDVSATFNFGSTGDLLAQITQSAPVDLFVSASAAHMDQAEASGLIDPASRLTFAGNILVLARPADSTIPITGLQDLASGLVKRIGIGKPETVTAGQYAKQALREAGVWDRVQEKLILGNSVRQILDYLRRGEIDAGLVFATDVRVARDQVRIAAELANCRVEYTAALVAASRERKEAGKFLQYLATDAARTILADQGFQLP